ncbi:hypothetical protein POX33_28115, partial [Escherichia coli]
QYLVAGSVDYTVCLEGSWFIAAKPNAESTCCFGFSFTLPFVAPATSFSTHLTPPHL